ncbi:coiled-coil domain-containing protein [Paenibacillus ginsengarvi]|uniref:SbsC C-terminal domain-containing protein n=1 Tax=Paenibacillus ginsengarvi TaxID=400777 RepID=A0A3B0CMK5_9BACL|nr:hypothetical protein [Paenibacillus ginsengarvi]RKN86915.1 hypothetical protein D7M11_02880 [Paenibacillus ginsengarvi]
MRKRLLYLIMIGLGCLLLPLGALTATAQPEPEPKTKLLEKSLTMYELDREIARLSGEEKLLDKRIEETSGKVKQSAKLVEEQQQKTEKVIRSYYTGERRSLLLALVGVRSLQDALYVWEQLQTLLDNDRQTIDDYKQRYQTYKTEQAKLETDRRLLADTKAAFVAEKEKRLQAQEEVDRLLAASKNREQLEQEMNALRTSWEERGLPLFEQYFASLSEAMQHLPELLGQNSGMISIKGLAPKVTIGDEQLNRFLQQKSKTLEGFSFSFQDNAIMAGGKSGNVAISIKGRYIIENKPNNAVRFTIDSLTFNGYAMPESTAKSLEKRYDLSFYPTKLAPFIQATEVKIATGTMTIALKIGL